MNKFNIIEHKYHKCNDEDCNICSGGLFVCDICCGAEGSLLTNCPGFKLNGEAEEACYNGNVIDLDRIREAVLNGYNIKKKTWK